MIYRYIYIYVSLIQTNIYQLIHSLILKDATYGVSSGLRQQMDCQQVGPMVGKYEQVWSAAASNLNVAIINLLRKKGFFTFIQCNLLRKVEYSS